MFEPEEELDISGIDEDEQGPFDSGTDGEMCHQNTEQSHLSIFEEVNKYDEKYNREKQWINEKRATHDNTERERREAFAKQKAEVLRTMPLHDPRIQQIASQLESEESARVAKMKEAKKAMNSQYKSMAQGTQRNYNDAVYQITQKMPIRDKPAAIMEEEARHQEELNQYKQNRKEATAYTEEKEILKQLEDKLDRMTDDMRKTKDQNRKFHLSEEIKKEMQKQDSIKAELKRKKRKTIREYNTQYEVLRLQHIRNLGKIWKGESKKVGTQRSVPVMAARDIMFESKAKLDTGIDEDEQGLLNSEEKVDTGIDEDEQELFNTETDGEMSHQNTEQSHLSIFEEVNKLDDKINCEKHSIEEKRARHDKTEREGREAFDKQMSEVSPHDPRRQQILSQLESEESARSAQMKAAKKAMTLHYNKMTTGIQRNYVNEVYHMTQEMPITDKPAAIMKEEVRYQEQMNEHEQKHKEANAYTEEKQILKQLEDKIRHITDDMLKTQDQNCKFRLSEEIKKETKKLDSFKAEQQRIIKKSFHEYKKLCEKERQQHIRNIGKTWKEESKRAGTQRSVPVMAARELESNSRKDYHTRNVETQGISSEIRTGKRKRTEHTPAISIIRKKVDQAPQPAMPTFENMMQQAIEESGLPPPKAKGQGKPTVPWYQGQNPMKQQPANWKQQSKYENVTKEAEKTKEEEQTTSEPVDTGNAKIQPSDEASRVGRELEQQHSLGPRGTKLPIKLAYKLNRAPLGPSGTKLPLKLAYKLNRTSVINTTATHKRKHVSEEALIEYTCQLIEGKPLGLKFKKKVGKLTNQGLGGISNARRKAMIDAKNREQCRKKSEPNLRGNENQSKYKTLADMSAKRAEKEQQFNKRQSDERQQQAAKEEKERVAAAKEAAKKDADKKEAKRKAAAFEESRRKEVDSKAEEHRRMQKQSKEPSDAEKHASKWKAVTKEYEEKKSETYWRPW